MPSLRVDPVGVGSNASEREGEAVSVEWSGDVWAQDVCLDLLVSSCDEQLGSRSLGGHVLVIVLCGGMGHSMGPQVKTPMGHIGEDAAEHRHST